jgi:flagellar biosynthesis protein FlhG
MVLNEQEQRKIIPVASGKGGVGKSVVAANLGVILASYGKRVVLVDLDLGGSNLHTYLGIKNRNPGIGNYVQSKNPDFNEILVDTPYNNVKFVAGDVLVTGTANLTQTERRSVMRAIESLDADYVILDLGSGTSLNVVDFFLLSNTSVVVTTPQTPSILNAYSLLKNATFRHLLRTFTKPRTVANYLKDIVKEKQPGGTPTIAEILEHMHQLDRKTGDEATSQLARLHPYIVVNMAETPEDMDITEELRNLIFRNLQVDAGCLGLVFNDRAVGESVRKLQPVSVADHEALASKELDRIAQKILQSPRFPVMPLDYSEYESSFGLARIEAQNDFVELEDKPGTQSATISHEDFMEIIAAQQKKIEELRGTVRMLTLDRKQ